MAQETLEETFQVTRDPSLSIHNVRGSIRVVPGEDDQIHVTAEKHGSEAEIERTEVQILQEDDGRVSVKTIFADSETKFFGFGGSPCKVDYTVQVPAHCAVTANGVSSAAHIQDLAGPLSVKSVSGPVSANNLEGELLLESVSGKIEGAKLRGDLILKTVSGDAKLQDSELSSVQGKTVSGDFSMATGLSEGPYAFKSVSGNIKLRVPSETGGTIRMSSISGTLDTGQKTTRTMKHGGPLAQRQVFEMAGVGPDVNFHTVSGTLRVRTPDGGVLAAEVPAQPKPVESSESRRSILEKIAAGDLSVDDGVAALEQN